MIRLGATQPTKVDIRVLAATNRDIRQALKEGALRQDLYFRLNVVALNIPPLSQRREDIPLLASYFLQKFSVEMKRDIQGISPQALEKLMNYPFPGNVRELINIIERGCALSRTQQIEMNDLPDELRDHPPTAFHKRDGRIPPLNEQEKDYIQWVIGEVGGNHTAAAQALGINRSSLWRKLKGYRES